MATAVGALNSGVKPAKLPVKNFSDILLESKCPQILNLATTYINKLLQIKNSRTRLASASNEALLLPSSDKEISLLKFFVTSQS